MVHDWSELANFQNETKTTVRPRPCNLPGTPIELINGLVKRGGPEVEYAWHKPRDIWIESEWLFWVDQWICASDEDLQDAFGITFLDGVERPPAKLFTEVMELMFDRDPTSIATKYGPLGRCACNWNGHADSWWRSLHPSHELVETRITANGCEVLQIRQESLQTWRWVGDRSWKAYQLAEAARSVSGGTEAAAAIGRPWPEIPEFRHNMVEVEMLGWGALMGSLNPAINDESPDSAKGFLKWVANQVVQHPLRLCMNENCRTRFERNKNQRYCSVCQKIGIPARNRKRATRDKRES